MLRPPTRQEETMASPYNLGDDELLSPVFWEGVAEGEFRIQHCRGCGRVRFPPSSFCPDCHGVQFDWQPATGQATVWSYTVVHRAPTPDRAADVPYTLVVGQLSEGPLVLARTTPGSARARSLIGLPIALGFHTEADGAARYHFLPTGHRAGPGSPPAGAARPDVGPTGASQPERQPARAGDPASRRPDRLHRDGLVDLDGPARLEGRAAGDLGRGVCERIGRDDRVPAHVRRAAVGGAAGTNRRRRAEWIAHVGDRRAELAEPGTPGLHRLLLRLGRLLHLHPTVEVHELGHNHSPCSDRHRIGRHRDTTTTIGLARDRQTRPRFAVVALGSLRRPWGTGV